MADRFAAGKALIGGLSAFHHDGVRNQLQDQRKSQRQQDEIIQVAEDGNEVGGSDQSGLEYKRPGRR